MNSIKNNSPLCSVKLELMETKCDVARIGSGCDSVRIGSGCDRSRPNCSIRSLVKIRKGISLPLADTLE